MILKNWTKLTTLAASAVMALTTLPAISQAQTYTGRTPARISASQLTTKHTVKVSKKHKKHKKHKKAKKTLAKHHHTTSAKANA